MLRATRKSAAADRSRILTTLWYFRCSGLPPSWRAFTGVPSAATRPMRAHCRQMRSFKPLRKKHGRCAGQCPAGPTSVMVLKSNGFQNRDTRAFSDQSETLQLSFGEQFHRFKCDHAPTFFGGRFTFSERSSERTANDRALAATSSAQIHGSTNSQCRLARRAQFKSAGFGVK